MTKTYLDLLSSSRIRPKMISYFVNNGTPIGTRKLARLINEDVGAVGHLIREYRDSIFIVKSSDGWVLAPTDVHKELIALTKQVPGGTP